MKFNGKETWTRTTGWKDPYLLALHKWGASPEVPRVQMKWNRTAQEPFCSGVTNQDEGAFRSSMSRVCQKMTETISPAHRHKSESDSDSGTLNIHYFLVLVPQNLSQVIYQHCDIIY